MIDKIMELYKEKTKKDCYRIEIEEFVKKLINKYYWNVIRLSCLLFSGIICISVLIAICNRFPI